MRLIKIFSALAMTTALSTPTMLAAQTTRERDLETRVQQLEQALSALQARPAPAVTPAPAVASVQATPAPAAIPPAPVDGFQSGKTRIKIGGFVRLNMIGTRTNDGEMPVGALGREFYLPQQIPVGNGAAANSLLLSARQTRLAVSTETPLSSGDIKTHIEFDFALAAAPVGAQRATNPYVPTFRRGFIQYGGLLIGQEWTTFQNLAVLPESTDFVGPLDGTAFVRQGIIQYKQQLGRSLDLMVAVENPETETVGANSPAMGDNDDDRFPDFVTRLNLRSSLGEFSLAGIARELRAQSGDSIASAFGWGTSVAGRVPFAPGSRHDVRFMATYGQGVGRYLGLGFAPDAIQFSLADGRLNRVDNFAAFAAVKLGWTDRLRSTFTYSFQQADYVRGTPGGVNEQSETGAGNLFWSPLTKFDVGLEYRRGHRTLLNGLSGRLDRVEFAAKYGF